jgi:6-phosphogluconolactonase (cycloisomerase 2 family)
MQSLNSKENARMRSLTRLVGTAALAAATLATSAAAFAGPAGAAVTQHQSNGFPGARHAVFVQTDNLSGNHVVAYHRAADGRLSKVRSYPTGGVGGALTGSAVDHLASQGSLNYDAAHALLIAVNAGSNTISVFSVRGDRLALRQVIGSGGRFPVSVAARGNLVYVANAENGGSVQGYRVLGGRLARIHGSHRALGLDPAATPQFTNTPGQVAFSPRGSQLIVTTKANGNNIDVFGVRFDGSLTASPVVNPEPGTVPFGVTFDQAGHLVVAETGLNALGTFRLHANGTLTLIDSVATGQAATCWVAPARGRFFASNAGTANVSGFADTFGGQLALLGQTSTDPGTVDASASHNGHFLYVQTGGSGIVDEFHVSAGGALTSIGSVTVPGAVAGEGIVAH